MSKSTTRGRQRGRRRNRPLRCEASTRMREWMCYRNHLVRRRGSAHGTSGRCPFHITKFSPGRSCWARESYSCPEYLMEMGWWPRAFEFLGVQHTISEGPCTGTHYKFVDFYVSTEPQKCLSRMRWNFQGPKLWASVSPTTLFINFR